MDIINEYLQRTRNVVEIKFAHTTCLKDDVRPHMKCKDGFTVSVQAGEFYYCYPRIDGAAEYETVELGYPSMADELIMSYAEDYEHPTDTVYGNVPVNIVCQLVEKHGGIIN